MDEKGSAFQYSDIEFTVSRLDYLLSLRSDRHNSKGTLKTL